MKTDPDVDTITDPKANVLAVDVVAIRLAVVADARRALSENRAMLIISRDGYKAVPVPAGVTSENLAQLKYTWLGYCDSIEEQLRNPRLLPPTPNRWRVIEELARRWVLQRS